MNVLLVTYDLNNETRRPRIVEKIEGLGSSCVQLSESCYVITTSRSPNKVYECLKGMIDTDDTLHVVALTTPWVGYDDKKVTKWMKKNLPA